MTPGDSDILLTSKPSRRPKPSVTTTSMFTTTLPTTTPSVATSLPSTPFVTTPLPTTSTPFGTTTWPTTTPFVTSTRPITAPFVTTMLSTTPIATTTRRTATPVATTTRLTTTPFVTTTMRPLITTSRFTTTLPTTTPSVSTSLPTTRLVTTPLPTTSTPFGTTTSSTTAPFVTTPSPTTTTQFFTTTLPTTAPFVTKTLSTTPVATTTRPITTPFVTTTMRPLITTSMFKTTLPTTSPSVATSLPTTPTTPTWSTKTQLVTTKPIATAQVTTAQIPKTLGGPTQTTRLPTKPVASTTPPTKIPTTTKPPSTTTTRAPFVYSVPGKETGTGDISKQTLSPSMNTFLFKTTMAPTKMTTPSFTRTTRPTTTRPTTTRPTTTRPTTTRPTTTASVTTQKVSDTDVFVPTPLIRPPRPTQTTRLPTKPIASTTPPTKIPATTKPSSTTTTRAPFVYSVPGEETGTGEISKQTLSPSMNTFLFKTTMAPTKMTIPSFTKTTRPTTTRLTAASPTTTASVTSQKVGDTDVFVPTPLIRPPPETTTTTTTTTTTEQSPTGKVTTVTEVVSSPLATITTETVTSNPIIADQTTAIGEEPFVLMPPGVINVNGSINVEKPMVPGSNFTFPELTTATTSTTVITTTTVPTTTTTSTPSTTSTETTTTTVGTIPATTDKLIETTSTISSIGESTSEGYCLEDMTGHETNRVVSEVNIQVDQSTFQNIVPFPFGTGKVRFVVYFDAPLTLTAVKLLSNGITNFTMLAGSSYSDLEPITDESGVTQVFDVEQSTKKTTVDLPAVEILEHVRFVNISFKGVVSPNTVALLKFGFLGCMKELPSTTKNSIKQSVTTEASLTTESITTTSVTTTAEGVITKKTTAVSSIGSGDTDVKPENTGQPRSTARPVTESTVSAITTNVPTVPGTMTTKEETHTTVTSERTTKTTSSVRVVETATPIISDNCNEKMNTYEKQRTETDAPSSRSLVIPFSTPVTVTGVQLTGDSEGNAITSFAVGYQLYESNVIQEVLNSDGSREIFNVPWNMSVADPVLVSLPFNTLDGVIEVTLFELNAPANKRVSFIVELRGCVRLPVIQPSSTTMTSSTISTTKAPTNTRPAMLSTLSSSTVTRTTPLGITTEIMRQTVQRVTEPTNLTTTSVTTTVNRIEVVEPGTPTQVLIKSTRESVSVSPATTIIVTETKISGQGSSTVKQTISPSGTVTETVIVTNSPGVTTYRESITTTTEEPTLPGSCMENIETMSDVYTERTTSNPKNGESGFNSPNVWVPSISDGVTPHVTLQADEPISIHALKIAGDDTGRGVTSLKVKYKPWDTNIQKYYVEPTSTQPKIFTGTLADKTDESVWILFAEHTEPVKSITVELLTWTNTQPALQIDFFGCKRSPITTERQTVLEVTTTASGTITTATETVNDVVTGQNQTIRTITEPPTGDETQTPHVGVTVAPTPDVQTTSTALVSNGTTPEIGGCTTVDGTSYQYGDELPSLGPCRRRVCERGSGIVEIRVECDLTCDGKLRYVEKQCCPVCEKESRQCLRESRMERLQIDGCISRDLVEITSCSGGCPSRSFVDMATGAGVLRNECRCCQPLMTNTRDTLLDCGRGETKGYSYTVIEACTCEKCEFGNNMIPPSR